MVNRNYILYPSNACSFISIARVLVMELVAGVAWYDSAVRETMALSLNLPAIARPQNHSALVPV